MKWLAAIISCMLLSAPALAREITPAERREEKRNDADRPVLERTRGDADAARGPGAQPYAPALAARTSPRFVLTGGLTVLAVGLTLLAVLPVSYPGVAAACAGTIASRRSSRSRM